jgi:hypothetical protein
VLPNDAPGGGAEVNAEAPMIGGPEPVADPVGDPPPPPHAVKANAVATRGKERKEVRAGFEKEEGIRMGDDGVFCTGKARYGSVEIQSLANFFARRDVPPGTGLRDPGVVEFARRAASTSSAARRGRVLAASGAPG